MSSDIFHSEPMKGAVLIDATGPGSVITVDIQNRSGKYHFELPGDLPYQPTNEIRLASKLGDVDAAFNITLSVSGYMQRVMV